MIKRIIKRPKMILAVTLLLALAVDCVTLSLGVPRNIILILTACWLLLCILVVILCKKIVQLTEKHLSFKKYFLPRPIRKVSAVIPNYNYADYLKERVESIVSQTYPICELIILDDCSTDNSVEVIEEIIENLKVRKPELKVRFVPNKKNSGNVFKQWEKCFDESEGDFVWICEADDSCSKYFLSAVMRAFNDDKVVLSYAESATMDEKGEPQLPDLRMWADEFRVGHWDKDYINNGKDELRGFLCVNNTIVNASGVVFRKIDVPIKEYLRGAQKYRLVGDWYFYAKYLLHGKIAYCSESLNCRRMQPRSVTSTTDGRRQFLEIKSVQDSISKDVKVGRDGEKKIEKYRQTVLDSFGISEEELKYMEKPFARVLEKSKVDDDVLLSVIVSAHNAEEYIDKCLESVENSLPEKSEIIVVDDGSTDGTAEIVKKHQKKCDRLRYYRKKNGGLSSVKNFGLGKAEGRYVIFMDADDEIKPNGYEVMLKMALEKNADIVVCDMALIYDDGTVINCPVYHKDPGGLEGFLIDGLMASSNNKMVKKELYDKVGKYPEGLNNEDVAITPVLMVLAKKIEYVPSSFYKYYQRKGSIQNSEFSEKRFAIFDTVKMAIDSIRRMAPDKAKDIGGILIGNQLIALLVHVICGINDEDKRLKYIGEFCEKYRVFDVPKSRYIKKYCQDAGVGELPELLVGATPKEISTYVRKDDKFENFKDYIGRALGIKRLMREKSKNLA